MKRKTTKQFIEESQKIHQNKYDYSLTNYKGVHHKVKIICFKHGVFKQTPNAHLSDKSGCRKCKYENDAKYRTLTTKQFIKKAEFIHGDKFDYSLVKYIHNKQKVKIICYKHGSFFQQPNVHLSGKCGCFKCGRELSANKALSNTNEFIKKCKKIHGEKYKYDQSKYVGAFTKVKIKCKYHGTFLQQPNNHLSGQGCPKCIHTYSSPESDWLDLLGIPNNPKYRQVRIKFTDGTFVKVDGYNPKTNTVYEFYGDYWHGNPKYYYKNDINPSIRITYGKLYQKTLDRKQKLIDNGYEIVEIWETEWKNYQLKNGEKLDDFKYTSDLPSFNSW